MLNLIINMLFLSLRSANNDQKQIVTLKADGKCRLCSMKMKKTIYKGYLSSNDLQNFIPSKNIKYLTISDIFDNPTAIQQINKRLTPEQLSEFANLYTRGLLYDRERVLSFNPIQLFLHDICLYKIQLYIQETQPQSISDSFLIFSKEEKDYKYRTFYSRNIKIPKIFEILSNYQYDYLNEFKIDYIHEEIDEKFQSNLYDIQQIGVLRIIKNIENFIESKSKQISQLEFRNKVFHLILKEQEIHYGSEKTIISEISKLLKILIDESPNLNKFKNKLKTIFSSKKDLKDFYYFIYFIEILFSTEDPAHCEEITFDEQNFVDKDIEDLVNKYLKNMKDHENVNLSKTNKSESNPQNNNMEARRNNYTFQDIDIFSHIGENSKDLEIMSAEAMLETLDFQAMYSMCNTDESANDSLILYLFDLEKNSKTLKLLFKLFFKSYQSQFTPDFLCIFLSKFVFNDWGISELIVIVEFFIKNKINYLNLNDFKVKAGFICKETSLIDSYWILIYQFGIINISETILTDIISIFSMIPTINENFYTTEDECKELGKKLDEMCVTNAIKLKNFVDKLKLFYPESQMYERLNKLSEALKVKINYKKLNSKKIIEKILKDSTNDSIFHFLNDIKHISTPENLQKLSKNDQTIFMKTVKKYYDAIGHFPFGMLHLMAFDFQILFEFTELTEEYCKDFVLSLCEDLPNHPTFCVKYFARGIPYLINQKRYSIINAEKFIKFMNLNGLIKFKASIEIHVKNLQKKVLKEKTQRNKTQRKKNRKKELQKNQITDYKIIINDVEAFILLLRKELEKNLSLIHVSEKEFNPQYQSTAAKKQKIYDEKEESKTIINHKMARFSAQPN